MGFLNRITKNAPDSKTDGIADEQPTTASRSIARTAGRHNNRGIPPIKDPQLPPGRTAALIACTRTRRVYWIVFKQAPESEYGWIWERNVPAVPDEHANNQFDTATARSCNEGGEKLPLGGRDWGDWSCPGCGQPQILAGDNDFIHRRICKCGLGCCLGPGPDGATVPTCPNCQSRIPEEAQIRRTLAGTQHASQLPHAAGEIHTPDWLEIQ